MLLLGRFGGVFRGWWVGWGRLGGRSSGLGGDFFDDRSVRAVRRLLLCGSGRCFGRSGCGSSVGAFRGWYPWWLIVSLLRGTCGNRRGYQLLAGGCCRWWVQLACR